VGVVWVFSVVDLNRVAYLPQHNQKFRRAPIISGKPLFLNPLSPICADNLPSSANLLSCPNARFAAPLESVHGQRAAEQLGCRVMLSHS
jgi:hypothetical protein